MSTSRTYMLSGRYLYLQTSGAVFEVEADELRRVLTDDYARLKHDLPKAQLLGMPLDVILALRWQYDLRGGPAEATPETVARTLGKLPTIRITGGLPDATYMVDLTRRTVKVVRAAVTGSELRTYSYADNALAFEAAMRPERRYAPAPRRKPWGGAFPGRRAFDKAGRRAGDRLERRASGRAPTRRQGAEERRTSDFRQSAEWAHWCVKDYYKPHVLRSSFCPECGVGRPLPVERRALAHRRSPFSTGRRKEDA